VNEEMHKLNSKSDREVLASVDDDLLAACLDAGSRDNMSVSVLIVAFPALGLSHVDLHCVTPSLATIGNTLPVVDNATARVIDFDLSLTIQIIWYYS
jgi:hypothetical protein